MLLIMGMGFQFVHWPDAFCSSLSARGFHVVRFDNRDARGRVVCAGRHGRRAD